MSQFGSEDRGIEFLLKPFFIGLIIFIPVFLFFSYVFAAVEAPTGAATGTITTNSIQMTWANGGGTEADYVVEQSTDGTTFTIVSSTIATTTLSYTFTGLSINTQYTFRVGSTDGAAATSTYSTTTAKYTYANPAASVSLGSAATSSLAITFGVNSNPATTTYAIHNDTDGTYLTSTGVVTGTAYYYTTTTWGGTTVSLTGLTPSTAYEFSVIARNGNGVIAATTTASEVSTLANTPSSLSVTSASDRITVSWSGDATAYYASRTGANSGWISATSYTFTGLTCGASYTFTVIGKNGDDVETSEATVSGVASACGGGGSSGTSSPSTPSTPATPAPAETTIPASGGSTSFAVNVSTPVTIGSTSHTVLVSSATASQAVVTIQSDPVTVILALNTAEEIDTDGDGENDLKVTYLGLDASDKPEIEFISLTESTTPVTPVPAVTCALKSGKPYKYSSYPGVYYITEGCTRRAFVSPQVFFSYFTSWADVLLTEKNVLEGISNDSAGFMTLKTNSSPVVPAAPSVHYQFKNNLWSGQINVEVKELQKVLRGLGYFTYPTDTGKFGAITFESVKKFQRAQQITPVSGFVGPKTRAALNSL